MNKIVKSLNYNPVGNQSSVLSFSAVGTENLPANVYTTPRFSYFTLNGINYSFTNDATFLKGSNSVESLDQLSDNNVLKQGIFVEYPIYIATGDAFEEFTIVSVSEAGVNDIIDHSSIFVFVKDESNRWSEWNRVSNLYLESPTSTTFECRFNENQRYTLKFGNDITGKRLKTGYQVAVYYLKSDGTSGEIGPGVLSNNQMFLYNTPLYNDIMSNIRDANQNFLTSQQATNIVFSNPYARTSFTVLENTDAIRTNAANTFKTQYRLITTTDYENFIKTNYSNLIKDVKVVNNWEYLAEHVRYLYNLGLKTPSLDSRVLFNQLTFSDSCDFNNIYVYMVPRLQNNTLFSNFLPTGLKDLVINQVDSIDIKDCYIQTGIQSILGTMDQELVGLTDVKNRVREISSVLLFDRIREIQELSTLNSSLHMAFTGRPGTGKTSVAAKIALVLRNLGYLSKGHITNVTREDLVGQYVGHTAPKTREQLQRAQGGILFIDEAHHLYKPDNERDYGSEAVELLLQVMENQRDDLILIFSGGKNKIEGFFNSNPGVSSRIGNHVDFQDYNVEDLTQIIKFLLHNENRYKFTDEALEIFVF
jgi:probable Rubsico expression protein CbbX